MQLGASLPVGDIGTGPRSCATMRRRRKGSGFAYLRGARPRARRQSGCRSRRPARRHHGRPPITTRSCCSASWPACTQQDRLCRRRADPGAAPGGAGRQAGGLPRRAVRGPLPARHRRRLERGRVPGLERGFPHPRQALGGAGALHAGAVGRAARQIRRRVPPARRRRHQPAARSPAACRSGSAAMPRRPSGAPRKYGDGFMPLRLSAGRRGAGGLRQAARG